MKVVCRDAAGRSGFAAGTAVAAAGLDAEALATRAAAKVGDEPLAELGPGSWPVVLEPDAVALLLEFLGGLAFNGLAHAEGRGALSDRLGTSVAAPAIALADAPPRPARCRARSTSRACRRPGSRSSRTASRPASSTTAARPRSPATARGRPATRPRPAARPYGPSPTNLVLAGGAAADAAELASTIERGIYVTRLWYVNTVREKETLLTGMTRDGTFLIEDGAITRPIGDVRFTDSVLRMLAATEELTSARRLVSEGEFYGRRFATGVLCPALRAGGFRVTGATK